MTDAEREERSQLETEQARGRRIDQFLADVDVKAVLNGLELSYYTAWKAAGTPTERELIYSQVSAFDALRDSLRAIVTSGQLATHTLEGMARATDQI